MILDGKKLHQEILDNLRTQIAKLQRKPGLAFILVGSHSASEYYVRAKQKACHYVGIQSTLVTKPTSISESDLLHAIQDLNRDPKIDGILVQLPLPSHIDSNTIMSAIDPMKDVDGFHPINMGKLLLGQEDGFVPCTPLGIHTLLTHYRIPIEGKHVVILGRSNIVGKPLAALLMQKKPNCNATVTIAHSKSKDLISLTKSADILIAALGSAHFVKAEMVKPHATVIDVGINRLPNGSLVGDVDYASVAPIAAHITPVPGGIGPMTIASLLQNTVRSISAE